MKAFIVTRVKGTRSLREMTRLLDVDADTRLRKLCHIKPSEKGYLRSVLSRFIRKVGEDYLARIVEEKVVKLLKRNGAKEVDSVFNASFIKSLMHTPSTGQPKRLFRRRRKSPASGQNVRFRLQASIGNRLQDYAALTCIIASANQNEQKHSLSIIERTKLILKQSAAKLRSVIADTQYSDAKLRNAADKTVIPYRANQKRGVRGALMVDKFRTHGSEDQNREYHKRPRIEAVCSFLKTQYSLAVNKVRRIKNVVSYALYSLLCLVLNREAAENIGRKDKAVSTTYFNT